YLWSPSGATTDTAKALCTGNYCCTVTDKHGCVDSVCVSVVAGIDELSHSSAIQIFPDPNNGYFTISGLSKGLVIEVYNYIGQRISHGNADNASMEFNIADRPNGIYLVRILTKDGQLVQQSRIIKTN
ncbi:MAG TPA: T9SS type A sorting domain-containing protein, partial [Bacteroidia bacterium]|nr:T9SS type A sorting domain-containing protein [Bacteroidia bacterium]